MSIGRADIEAMLDDTFELGSAARFGAIGATPVDVRACPRIIDVEGADEFGLRVQQTARVIEVLKAEAGDVRPGKGDTIEILPGGMALAGVYTVLEEATSIDRYQLVWTCRVSEPE